MQVTDALQRSGEGARDIGMAHTIEVLDASFRGLPVTTLVPAAGASGTNLRSSTTTPA
jgi:glycolate oxidase iron-sulfur subunit